MLVCLFFSIHNLLILIDYYINWQLSAEMFADSRTIIACSSPSQNLIIVQGTGFAVISDETASYGFSIIATQLLVVTGHSESLVTLIRANNAAGSACLTAVLCTGCSCRCGHTWSCGIGTPVQPCLKQVKPVLRWTNGITMHQV